MQVKSYRDWETKAATTATTKQKEAVWGLGIALSQLAKQFNTLSSERAIETFGIDVDKTADAIMIYAPPLQWTLLLLRRTNPINPA